jgi:hypothetical protein
VSPDAVVRLLTSLASMVAGIVTALQGMQESIGAMLATARAAVPPPTHDAVEATIARHIADRHPRVTHATADVLSRIYGVTDEERSAIAEAVPALRAIAEAREIPPVLNVPVGAWSEPSGGKD